MDLYGPGIIGECKNVLSGLETLRQLDGYLGLCASGSFGAWRGHLIVSAGFTTELARAVSAREDRQVVDLSAKVRQQARLDRGQVAPRSR